MDPQDGLIQLTRLAMLRIEVEGEEVSLQDATAAQLQAGRTSRSRGPTVQAAKKGLKVYEELGKLAEALDLVEEMEPGKMRRTRQKGAAKGPTLQAPSSVVAERAIVPYVQKVESVKIVTPRQGENETFRIRVLSPQMKAALRPLKKGLQVAAWIPVVLAYTGVVYTLLLILYVIRHPEVLVKWSFAVLDALPSYAAYASSAILSQVEAEIKARLR
jgi:hypothetical protein